MLKRTSTSTCQTAAARRSQCAAASRRRGSTLVVVAALLGLLAVLGYMLFRFTSQELESALYFSEGGKERGAADFDPNVYFNFGLEQLILGPNELYSYSALAGGGEKALVPSLVGTDGRPYNGEGIRLRGFGALARVDQDGDGVPDTDQSLLERINHSAAANGGVPAMSDPQWLSRPQPDPDYTAPDINSQFLAYWGYALDDKGKPVFVVIPSFHRPQYLRSGPAGDPILDPHSNAATAARVLFPHVDHEAPGAPGVRRYITPAEWADPTRQGELVALGATGPYPFTRHNQGVWALRPWSPMTPYEVNDWVVPPNSNGWFYRCVAAGTSSNVEPPWPTTDGAVFTETGGVQWETRRQPFPEYDADPSGIGVKDAGFLDLQFPSQQLGDNRKYIPLFAFKVICSDSKGNLNAHGLKLNRDLTIGAGPFGGGSPIHKSHQGLSPAEISLFWLLTADPATDFRTGDIPSEVYQDLIDFFGHAPANFTEAANMEFLLRLIGRLRYSGGVIVDATDGVFGERDRLLAAAQSFNFADFPMPGLSETDDNNNRFYGDRLALPGTRPFGSPLDWRAAGTACDATGKFPLFFNPPNSLNRWPQFAGVETRGSVLWANLIGNALMVDSSGTPIVPGGVSEPLVDEPEELELDPRFADAQKDRLLELAEMFFLMASNTDRQLVGAASRLEHLFHWNFVRNIRARDIRQQFTIHSADVQNYGLPRPTFPATAAQKFRPHEHEPAGVNSLGSTRHRFPPQFPGATATTQPFRPALQRWLESLAGDIDSNPDALRQRAYSLNHFLDDSSGSLVLRSLTEHHPDPGTRAIHELATSALTADELQEHNARRDRQLMARDFYVMLYTFCGGDDAANPLTTPNTVIGPDSANPGKMRRTLYDDVQLDEMAQFAINAVERLDRDRIIDAFEFDRDLSDGWNLDDNAYTDDGLADRGIVYGVEEQGLTFSEALILCFRQFTNPDTAMAADHLVTEFDDTQDRYFSFIELRHAGTEPISLRGNVRIEIETTDGTDTWVRKLTLLSDDPDFPVASRAIPPGGLFTILSAGDDHNRDPMTNLPRPSYVMLDLDLPANLMGPGAAPIYEDRYAPLPRGPFPLNATDLGRRVDLIVDDDANPPRFLLEGEKNGSPETVTIGGLLNEINIGAMKNSGGVTVKMRLYRRAHPDRAIPTGSVPANYDLDNPWIEVDRFRDLTLDSSNSVINITQKDDDAGIIQHVKQELIKIRSRERVDPLRRASAEFPNAEPDHPQAPAGAETQPNHDLVKLNTIATDNQASGDPAAGDRFQLWQLPGDRDYASSIELLSVPLYGPADLTKSLDPRGTNTAGMKKFLRPLAIGAYGADGKPGTAGMDDDGNGVTDDPGERGMGDDPDPSFNPLVSRKYDNRWHRLLGIVNVPIRNTPIDRFRNSGLVNLNTLHFPEMLAAMLDDEAAFELGGFHPLRPDADPSATDGKQSNYIVDRWEGATRDWWIEFIRARDRQDPLTRMYLPGMAHGRPFRSPSFLEEDVESIEYTLLRSLPADENIAGLDPDEVRRRLFELGTPEERYGLDPTARAVDYHTRHRLLSKMANYSTTRSNVFHVFMEVAFFEVIDDEGVERIGARIDTLPARRAYFVVDRSLAIERLKAGDFRPAGDPAGFSIRGPSEGGFNWRDLVLHRQLIQ